VLETLLFDGHCLDFLFLEDGSNTFEISVNLFRLYDVTSQKIMFFIVTVLRVPGPTSLASA
jgi:hypothetical protein